MKEILKNLPENPGCYIFLDSKKKIIYVGKAKNIKKRVLSYFNKKDLDPKTKALVSKIKRIDFIVTKTEVEALLLENNLIKKNKPKYNINLRDSKSYSLIEITEEEFPRLIKVRAERLGKEKKDKILFGPFVSGERRDIIQNTLNKTFKLRTCKKLPKKKCTLYDIGACSAPCINKISKAKYNKNVLKAKEVLKGKANELIKKLKKEMDKNSKSKNFEKALEIRNQIFSLERLNEKQNVERSKTYSEDIINYIIKNEKVHLLLFNINKGILENKLSFEFDYKEGFLEEFLVQYYAENKIPKQIILPENLDKSVEDFLSHKKGQRVKLVVPKRGDLKSLLDLVKKNVKIHFFGEIEKLEEIKRKLKMQGLPEVIECFDISHLGGTEVVASMIQFRNGQADKTHYRKFKIKTKDKNDDFAAIREVVRRRYSRLKNEGHKMPDLIVIDGGRGQLSSAISSLKEVGVKIPIISLAKKEEEIYLPGGEIIKLDLKNKGLLLLRQIRDEAHRFAVKYQRERRRKSYFG